MQDLNMGQNQKIKNIIIGILNVNCNYANEYILKRFVYIIHVILRNLFRQYIRMPINTQKQILQNDVEQCFAPNESVADCL